MCIKGTTTTHIRRRLSRVETEEGVVEVAFKTTLEMNLSDSAHLNHIRVV